MPFQIAVCLGPPTPAGDRHRVPRDRRGLREQLAPGAAPAICDQFGLAGGISITASDGETRHIGAGEIVLVEHTTGKGHITRSSGDRPRDTIFVPID